MHTPAIVLYTLQACRGSTAWAGSPVTSLTMVKASRGTCWISYKSSTNRHALQGCTNWKSQMENDLSIFQSLFLLWICDPRSFQIDEEVHSAPEASQRRKRAAPTICGGSSDSWFFGGPSYIIQITDLRSTDKTCLETNAWFELWFNMI